MAIVAIAIDPSPRFWDRAFALADRVDRAGPARGGAAPLRTRLNLLAAAAGVQPEADLWPRLRGVSACVRGDARQPGRPVAVLVALHVEDEASADRLAREFLPRIGSLIGEPMATDRPRGGPRPLGTILGRQVAFWRTRRDVMIAWGGDALTTLPRPKVAPERSLAAIYKAGVPEGAEPPQRFGAVWPGRLWRPGGGLGPSPAGLRALADDPPVVWSGWDDGDRAHDLLQWAGLADRARRFLETVPLDLP